MFMLEWDLDVPRKINFGSSNFDFRRKTIPVLKPELMLVLVFFPAFLEIKNNIPPKKKTRKKPGVYSGKSLNCASVRSTE